MSSSIYAEKLVQPDDNTLSHDLGDTKAYFDKIAAVIQKEYGDFKPEWKFYNQKSGWILKISPESEMFCSLCLVKSIFA